MAVWSADPEEQSLLAGEDVADELPQATGRPEIGFYVNGDKGDKLGYYLHADLAVAPPPATAAPVDHRGRGPEVERAGQ